VKKNLLSFGFLIFGIFSIFAQVPSGLNFQGVARDSDGKSLSNEMISVEIGIVNSVTGAIDYSETHNLETDAAGLFSLVIGSGSNSIGDYQGLEWSIMREVSVSIDITNDGNFDIEFTTPFQSVPYANFAKYAENTDDADADPMNEIQELDFDDGILSISEGNSVVLSQSSVVVGGESADVPENPEPGQLYFDELNDRFYIYHDEGWTLIELGETVSDIYAVVNLDADNDGINDSVDNCPNVFNPDQSNIDSDGFGDLCDDDIDGDGILNAVDDCPEDFNTNQIDVDGDGCEDEDNNGLHPAFAEFDSENYTIVLDGDNVIIESNGLPNHTSPYWSNTTERCTASPMGGGDLCTNENTTVDHPLFVAPTQTSFDQMAPGNIDDFNGSYSLTVPVNPQLAANSTSTGLGAIGMAVSGSMIYNDEEGPNVPLDNAVGSLDFTAAHTGPQSYHYHLEPKAWSDDDGELIGIIADGFFIYGRRDYDGTYPDDLDESGGHFGPTPHNPAGEYHYHIQNEQYLNQFYIIFPGDYQGTPNNIR